ncbi:CCDC90 family protein [Acidovorax sp. sic0104]|nr:CCDC90 family protein [Acidovorax sp. sic0104]
MNMNIPFDTLDFARKLASAGVPPAQAEQQSKLLADVLGKSVAFPSDLNTLERNTPRSLRHRNSSSKAA